MNLQKVLLAACALLMAGQAWGTEMLDEKRKKIHSLGQNYQRLLLTDPRQSIVAYSEAIIDQDEMALQRLIDHTPIPSKLLQERGETVVTLAAKEGLRTNNFRMLRQLLFFGAESNVKNQKGETIISIARNAQNAELQLCLKIRDNKQALYEQAQRIASQRLETLDIELAPSKCAEILGDSEIFNQRVEQAQRTGTDLPNCVALCLNNWLIHKRYKFPEHLTDKQKEICRLIERMQQKGGSMQAPLALAILADDPVMIVLCCIRGAQLDQQIDKMGTMPLMGAAMRGASDQVIRLLILMNADPNCRNRKSETVIDVLRQKDKKAMAEWLTTVNLNNLDDENVRLAYKEAAFRIIQLHFPQEDPARVLFDEALFFAKLFKGGRLDNLVDSCMNVYKISQLDKPAQIKKLKKWLDKADDASCEYLHLLMLRHRAGEDVAGPLDYDESGISVAHYAASKKNDSPLYTAMLKSLRNAVTQQDTERSVADARAKEKMAEELAVPDSSAAAAAPVEEPKKPSRKQLIQVRRRKEDQKEAARLAAENARRKEESDAARAINEEAALRDAREYEALLQVTKEELEKRDAEIFQEVEQSLSDILVRVERNEQERIAKEEEIRKEDERKIQEQAEQEKNKAIARALSSIVNGAVEQVEQQEAERLAKEKEDLACKEREAKELADRKAKEEADRKEVASHLDSMVARVEQQAAERERQAKEKAEREFKQRSAKVRSEGGRDSLLLERCASLEDAVDIFYWKQAQDGKPVQQGDREKVVGYIADDWIFEAIVRGDLDGVKACIEQHGVNINARGRLGRKDTPLYAAVNAQQPDIVEYLLSKGADFKMTNADGKTPGFRAEQLLRESPSKLSAEVFSCFKNILKVPYIKGVIIEVSDKWVSSERNQNPRQEVQAQRAAEADALPASSAAKSSAS